MQSDASSSLQVYIMSSCHQQLAHGISAQASYDQNDLACCCFPRGQPWNSCGVWPSVKHFETKQFPPRCCALCELYSYGSQFMSHLKAHTPTLTYKFLLYIITAHPRGPWMVSSNGSIWPRLDCQCMPNSPPCDADCKIGQPFAIG